MRNKVILILAMFNIPVALGSCCYQFSTTGTQSKLKPQVTEGSYQSMKINENYHGFTLVRKEQVSEIDSTALIFKHDKSGARLMKLVNDDDNKVFCMTFKTLPQDSTGVAHILEHSVLNGSKNFPVKNPFMTLAKGSLNTFLNAMTSSDHTMYPVASQNDKDFMNLMHVYLDAVLYPAIYDEPMILEQEGWHYEYDQEKNQLETVGVVFNEMKGAFSSPERELFFQIKSNIFPDTIYRYSSGGLPSDIPNLTYEDFINFHKTYYHPDNSYIFLYGDGDLDKELAFINDNYLQHFTATDNKIVIEEQKPFAKMKEVEKAYPIPEGSSEKDQTYLAISYMVGESADPEMSLALEILDQILVERPAAPIRKAIVEAGIGKNVTSSMWDFKQNAFNIIVQNANPEDKQKFIDTVNETLKSVVKQGFDKKSIEGIINRFEFRLREADYGSTPKGLVYNYMALNGWIHGGDPLLTLRFEEPLEKMKAVYNEGYFEKLVEQHLINNTHVLVTTIKPDAGLSAQLMEEEKQVMSKKLAALSDEEKQALIKRNEALKAYQLREDTPENMAKMPLLTIEDLNSKVAPLEVEEKEYAGIPVLHFDHNTSGIAYMKFLWDAQVVPQDKIHYLPILADVLGELDTKNYGYGDLDTEINIHTGGLHFHLSNYTDQQNPDIYSPKFGLSGKVLLPKLDKFIHLTQEMVLNTKFDDLNRLKELLNKQFAYLQANVKNNGVQLATTRLTAYMGGSYRYSEETSGLSYYHFFENLMKDLDQKKLADIRDSLADLKDLLFNRKTVTIGLTVNEDSYDKAMEQIGTLIKALPEKQAQVVTYKYPALESNEALLAASKVQYIVKGADYKKLGFTYSGSYRVLSQILSREYLQETVREQGGAYGAWMGIGMRGVSYFASYRDPNLMETFNNYNNAYEYLQKFNVSDREMTRFIIGTIAKMDRPMTPSQKGSVAMSNYFTHLTTQMRQQERDQVLATNQDVIKSFAPLVEKLMETGVYCVYGNEAILQENETMFSKLVKVTN